MRAGLQRDLTLTSAGLFFLAWACPALAQGQGSYGGIGQGFAQLVLFVIVVVVVLVAMLVRALFGTKVLVVVIAVGAAWLGHVVFKQKEEDALRRTASLQLDQTLAQGCAKTTRWIEHPAEGDEPVYIRLHGAEHVTERDRQILPTSEYLARGVKLLDGEPPDANRAIVVDITYSRDWVRSVHPDFRFHRLRYDLTAKTFPEGTLVASTTDMTAGESFCLGNVEDFLRQALNRPQVVWRGDQRSRTDLTLPDTYVQSEYAATTQGVYLKSDRPFERVPDPKAVLREHGCSITDQGEEALCGETPRGPVKLRLRYLVGIIQGADSWLLVYDDSRGRHRLLRLLVERRRLDWQLQRAWGATVVPPADFPNVLEHVGEISLDGKSMTAAIYSGQTWAPRGTNGGGWYAKRAALKIPLPGLTP